MTTFPEHQRPDHNPSDEEIFHILTSVRVIAVVGLSRDHEKASYRVASYLQEQGYWIIPVNPGAQEILGERSYKSLKEIPEQVDVALLFRRSEDVAPVVDEAMDIGVKVVWMQEGIVDNQAAALARSLGIQVVMDKCMMKEHKKAKIDTSL